MYIINKTIHPPTAVDNSIYCHFYSRQEKNLLITCNNLLKVYRLVREGADSTTESGDENVQQTSQDEKVRLECRQTFTFYGKIIAIEAVSFPGSARDSLLMCFPEAKISVVEYDQTTHDIKTISLHYFEEEDMKEGFTQFPIAPIIRVDPEHRCAAFLVFGRNIVILPFRKESTILSHETESTTTEPVGISATVSSLSASPDKSATSVRSPVMASYRLNLSDELYAGEKINNILEIQFLEGYHEPTLLILHEPVKTWSARLAVRQDTCSMVTLSINLTQKVHPIIWSVNSLPYDCFKAVAVPRPVGGVLIFASNSLIYLNQSVPPFAVSVNGFNESCTAFPMEPQKGIKLSLDASRSCFISSDKLIVALKGGDLYVLTLFNDSSRSIKKFHFQKAASSVMSSCIVKCDEDFVFLGSRLGNSLLLRYNEKPYEPEMSIEAESSKNDVTTEEESASTSNQGIKRKFSETLENGDETPKKVAKTEDDDEAVLEDLGDWMAKDIKLITEDDLEVYGEAHDEVEKLPTTFSFEVCDSIANIAPCGKMVMGEPAFISEEFTLSKAPQVELVTTSGFGKNGALSLLQRSIRPQIVTTLELPNCTDIWSVFSPHESAEHHSYLIISRNDSTMVFQAATEINELDQSGFSTQTRTIIAANIGDNKFIVQITPNGARLLEGRRQVHYLPLDFGSPVAVAFVCDPFVILLTENGLVIQLKLSLEGQKRLVVFKPKLAASKSRILALCLYKDVSGLFSTQEFVPAECVVKKEQEDVKPVTKPAATMEIDDEDELLYGATTVEDIAKKFRASTTESTSEAVVDKRPKITSVSRSKPSFWLFVSRDNGVLEIYSIPDYKLCFYVKNFPMTPKVLVDSGQGTDQQQQQQFDSMPLLKEILVVGFGVKESRPLLFARFEDELLVYEAFPFHETPILNHLKLRFRKLNETVVLRPIKRDEELQTKAETVEEFTEVLRSKRTWLKPFSDISGYSGVFLCGSFPSWFFVTSRGELRRHEMNIDGAIMTFASFHNINCSKGFLYFNQKNDLRISLLPTQVTYDATWPLRKIPLKCTVHHINYHVQSKCYIVVTSTQETFDKLVRVAGEEKDYEVLERDDNYIWPTLEKFSMELFSPVSWDAIAGTKVDFEEWEHVTSIKNVSLLSEETQSGLKGYMAIGSNYCYGEDVTNRGRICILDIIDVVPEPGLPLTRNKIKQIYNKEQKGPVTALCDVKGFLLSAIGQKIYIWQLKEDNLVGIAFIDTQIYIHNALSVKNLILVADVYKSISLLRYQEETRTLALVSRDTRACEVYACQFIVDQNQLCFVISDVDSNIIVYSYSPEMRESYGGTRLIRRADFFLGSQVVTYFRIRVRSPELSTPSPSTAKQMTVYATLDGSVGYLLPVVEKTYRRLLMLQTVLTSYLQHLAGLNPKGYRISKTSRTALLPSTSRVILDGDLIFKFVNLSLTEKREVSRKIGTTINQVVDDLNQLSFVTSHF